MIVACPLAISSHEIFVLQGHRFVPAHPCIPDPQQVYSPEFWSERMKAMGCIHGQVKMSPNCHHNVPGEGSGRRLQVSTPLGGKGAAPPPVLGEGSRWAGGWLAMHRGKQHLGVAGRRSPTRAGARQGRRSQGLWGGGGGVSAEGLGECHGGCAAGLGLSRGASSRPIPDSHHTPEGAGSHMQEN